MSKTYYYLIKPVLGITVIKCGDMVLHQMQLYEFLYNTKVPVNMKRQAT